VPVCATADDSRVLSRRTDLNLILQRQSPLALRDPGPADAALKALFTAAMCAPDHGRLKPWRFIVIAGDGRRAFGQMLADALEKRQPDVNDSLLSREREKALRAPLIVVVAAKVTEHKSVPAVEQIVAAGIAANNVLLAAGALGFGGMWRTGAAAYDPLVKSALGVGADDTIVGFLYLGTPDRMPPPRALPALAEFVREWPNTAEKENT
jgi:nitroreductase